MNRDKIRVRTKTEKRIGAELKKVNRKKEEVGEDEFKFPVFPVRV